MPTIAISRRPPRMWTSAARFGIGLVRASKSLRRVTTSTSKGSLATWIGGPAKGRPVVFLHGFCGDHTNLAPLALAVAKRRPVVLFDARGHGKSAGFTGIPRMSQLAVDLADVLDQWAPNGADVAGLSMGAQTVFEFFAQGRGDRLHQVAFIDQSPKVLCDAQWPHGLFGSIDDDELAQVRDSLKNNPRKLGTAWLRGMWRSNERLGMKLLLSPGMATGLRSVPAATLRLADDMLNQDWREVVAQINQPTLLLYGGRSIYPGAGWWMSQAIPHARLVHFDRAGHALIFEETARASEALTRFFH